ncbi:MAG: Gfo/Idh/MocA family protein [Woeseiaceae bacterium]
MTNAITRFGVIGAGNIATVFANDLRAVPNTTISAVLSRTPASAAAFAKQFDVETTHETSQGFFEDSTVDVIYIATPHTLHFDYAMRGIAVGKPVLCEKPLVTSMADCEKLVQSARRHQVLLTEALWSCFLPAWQQAQAWIAAGEIGQVLKLTADFGFDMRPFDPNKRVYNAAVAGGCLLDMGIYPLALAQAIFDRLPESVASRVRFAPNGVEDDFQSVLDFGDASAVVGASFRATHANKAIIIGDRGWIEMPQFWKASECQLHRSDQLIDVFAAPRETIGLDFETRAFVADYSAGRRESTVMSLDRSLGLMKSMEMVRASFG